MRSNKFTSWLFGNVLTSLLFTVEQTKKFVVLAFNILAATKLNVFFTQTLTFRVLLLILRIEFQDRNTCTLCPPPGFALFDANKWFLLLLAQLNIRCRYQFILDIALQQLFRFALSLIEFNFFYSKCIIPNTTHAYFFFFLIFFPLLFFLQNQSQLLFTQF